MTIRDDVLSRIKGVHDKRAIKHSIVYGTSGIEEVLCKCCGNHMRHLAPDGRFQEMRVSNGKKILCERLTLITLPAYIEVLITFDDGSKHVSAICKDCVNELTLADMEWVYCCDLHEWLFDGSNANDSFWEQQFKRKPVSFEVFPPGVIAS